MTRNSTQHFIETINADRDQKIYQIRTDTDAEIQQILSEAHQRSRQLQHATNTRLRSELPSRRHKEISRIQARLRRQLWQSLAQLQHDIKRQVLDKIQLAWAEPGWQRAWCKFWLERSAEGEQSTALQVTIDPSAFPETLESIKGWADQKAHELVLDTSLDEAGLIISWLDFELDGRLSAQGRTIEDEVLALLGPKMPQLQQVDTL